VEGKKKKIDVQEKNGERKRERETERKKKSKKRNAIRIEKKRC